MLNPLLLELLPDFVDLLPANRIALTDGPVELLFASGAMERRRGCCAAALLCVGLLDGLVGRTAAINHFKDELRLVVESLELALFAILRYADL